MSIIATVDDDAAAGLIAELYAEDIDDQGFVSAHTRVLGLNPEAMRAFEELVRAVTSSMDPRRYELVTLAAALGARSRHCRLAHGRRMLAMFDADELTRIAVDYRHAGLSEAEVAMMAFAERVSGDASEMTDADTLALREAGFSDREIVDITLAAAVRNYYSRAVQALAVPVEDPEDIPVSVRRALVAGI